MSDRYDGPERRKRQPVTTKRVVLVCFIVLGLASAAQGFFLKNAISDASRAASDAKTAASDAKQAAATSRSLAAQSKRLAAASARLSREGQQAHDALCVVKESYAAQIRSTKAFLRDPPREFSSPVIIKLTRQMVADTQRRLDSLDTLKCKP